MSAIPLAEALLLLTGAVAGVFATLYGLRRRARLRTAPARRILFPYVGAQLSLPALDAALRIARFEDAALVPVYLAPVPMAMPLEAPMPRVCDRAFELQEALEQRAAAVDVPVDGRIERGRTVRHALRAALAAERYDRIVVAAASTKTDGLSADEVAWLLEHAEAEVVVLRPDNRDYAAAHAPSPPRRLPALPHRTRGRLGDPAGAQR